MTTILPTSMGLRMNDSIVVGVDASRNRSGGARAHLSGLLTGSDPRNHGIKTVHLWAYRALRDTVADQPWLVKHTDRELEGSVNQQLFWQYASLPKIVERTGCNVLFNTDAGSICPVRRAVTLSQDMLSFEPGEIQRYGMSRARARLEVLKQVQAHSLKRSLLAIFLTEYARQTIQTSIGTIANSVVIPHGIDEKFRTIAKKRRGWPEDGPVKCIYVSNVAPYKHQWHVVEAFAQLRQLGYPVQLTLVGGGKGQPQARLEEAMARLDPERRFVRQEEYVPNDRIPGFLAESDLFIFSSSCENLPITLLEAMASGIPICSSNRGPMPEVLERGGCYFDPEDAHSIVDSIRTMIDDSALRMRCVVQSLERSLDFTWQRCSEETWRALSSVAPEGRTAKKG